MSDPTGYGNPANDLDGLEARVQGRTSGPTEQDLVDAHVDRDPRVNGPGVPNEEEILRKLYGEPDEDGVFRGEEVSE